MFNPLKLIFPAYCINCQTPGTYLCPKCRNLLDHHPIQRCSECNQPSTSGKTHPRCQKPLSIDGIWAIFKNKPPINKLIYQYKYGLSSTLNQTLADIIKPYLPTFFGSEHIFVPMPIANNHQRWRGFNQTAYLAKSIAKSYNAVISESALIRPSFARSQAQLATRTLRQHNQTLKFKLNPEYKSKIKNKHIVLIDDIATTGTTLKKAAQVLKRNQATSVWGLVIAR